MSSSVVKITLVLEKEILVRVVKMIEAVIVVAERLSYQAKSVDRRTVMGRGRGSS